MNVDALGSWIGRDHTVEDVAAAAPLAGLACLLDHESPPWRHGELPPLGHWLYFLPRERQSLLDVDGHPRRGGFLPPVPLPRRMWVGSRIHFIAPIPVGAVMKRRSTIANITSKDGRAGPIVFVAVKHEITVDANLAVIEEQDIVYRAASGPAAAAATNPVAGATATMTADIQTAGAGMDARLPQATRSIVADSLCLFRFSALTFNAHRIHYDRDYARGVEGYPGLVVHGPLVATLLMDHFLRHSPGMTVRTFHFRASRPLFDGVPFNVCLAPQGATTDLWAVDSSGGVAYTAAVEHA